MRAEEENSPGKKFETNSEQEIVGHNHVSNSTIINISYSSVAGVQTILDAAKFTEQRFTFINKGSCMVFQFYCVFFFMHACFL